MQAFSFFDNEVCTTQRNELKSSQNKRILLKHNICISHAVMYTHSYECVQLGVYNILIFNVSYKSSFLKIVF